MKAQKVYKIKMTRYRYSGVRESFYSGTLEELKKSFSYTLECGRSWQHEKGRAKIPELINIKTIKTFVKAINNAEDNRAANGYSGISYELVEE